MKGGYGRGDNGIAGFGRVAAEEAEGRSDRRDYDPVLGRSASTSPLISRARSKADGDGARGGRAP